MRSRTEKSVVPGRYFHDAVIEVARIRSLVSASVVYSSRGNPENAESAVFITTRFVTPDTTDAPIASRVIAAVQSPARAWTNARGCATPLAATRDHGCSTMLISTREIAGFAM